MELSSGTERRPLQPVFDAAFRTLRVSTAALLETNQPAGETIRARSEKMHVGAARATGDCRQTRLPSNKSYEDEAPPGIWSWPML